MKTIIVPTDFSEEAKTATTYALQMAKELQASVTFLHVYEIPVAVTDTPLMLVSVEDLQVSAEAKLDKLKEELEKTAGKGVGIITVAKLGNIIDEIDVLATALKPLCIIMSTSDQPSLERSIFGSSTLTAVRELSWPVIAVPAGKVFGNGVKKIVFASDYKEVLETTPFDKIKEFVRLFGAELHVLNVDHKNKQYESDTPLQSEHLYSELEEINPQYHFVDHSDIEKGIDEFSQANNVDLIIAIPKKHKLLQGLFQKSSVKQLVFHAHIPVMCIHG